MTSAPRTSPATAAPPQDGRYSCCYYFCCCCCECGSGADAASSLEARDGVYEQEFPPSEETLEYMARLRKLGIVPAPALAGAPTAAAAASATAIAPPQPRSMVVLPSAQSTTGTNGNRSSGHNKVLLNVYHLVDADANLSLLRLGVGVFHAGVVVLGREYSFGVIEYDDDDDEDGGEAAAVENHLAETGVFVVEPGTAAGELFRTVDLGATPLSPAQIAALVARLRVEYRAHSYHILGNNCASFAEDFCQRLSTRECRLHFPAWVNRLARIGDRLLPRSFATWAIRRYVQGPGGSAQVEENERKSREALQRRLDERIAAARSKGGQSSNRSAAVTATTAAGGSVVAVDMTEEEFEMMEDFVFDFGGLSPAEGNAKVPLPMPEDDLATDVVRTPNGTRWTLFSNGDVSVERGSAPPAASAPPPPSAAPAGSSPLSAAAAASPSPNARFGSARFNIVPRAKSSASRRRSHSAGGGQPADFEFDLPLAPELVLSAADGTQERIVMVGSSATTQAAPLRSINDGNDDDDDDGDDDGDDGSPQHVLQPPRADSEPVDEIQMRSASASCRSAAAAQLHRDPAAFVMSTFESPERGAAAVSAVEATPQAAAAASAVLVPAAPAVREEKLHVSFPQESFDHVRAANEREMLESWKAQQQQQPKPLLREPSVEKSPSAPPIDRDASADAAALTDDDAAETNVSLAQQANVLVGAGRGGVPAGGGASPLRDAAQRSEPELGGLGHHELGAGDAAAASRSGGDASGRFSPDGMSSDEERAVEAAAVVNKKKPGAANRKVHNNNSNSGAKAHQRHNFDCSPSSSSSSDASSESSLDDSSTTRIRRRDQGTAAAAATAAASGAVHSAAAGDSASTSNSGADAAAAGASPPSGAAGARAAAERNSDDDAGSFSHTQLDPAGTAAGVAQQPLRDGGNVKDDGAAAAVATDEVFSSPRSPVAAAPTAAAAAARRDERGDATVADTAAAPRNRDKLVDDVESHVSPMMSMARPGSATNLLPCEDDDAIADVSLTSHRRGDVPANVGAPAGSGQRRGTPLNNSDTNSNSANNSPSGPRDEFHREQNPQQERDQGRSASAKMPDTEAGEQPMQRRLRQLAPNLDAAITTGPLSQLDPGPDTASTSRRIGDATPSDVFDQGGVGAGGGGGAPPAAAAMGHGGSLEREADDGELVNSTSRLDAEDYAVNQRG